MAKDPDYTTVCEIATGRTWFFRDGEPCEPVPSDDRLLALLEELRRRGASETLRRFALWCARGAVSRHWSGGRHALIEIGERRLRGPLSAEDRAEWNRQGGTAMAAGAIGLRHGAANAAAYLAAWACVNDDEFVAATQAARMAQLAEHLSAARTDDLDPAKAADEEKTRQIDWLFASVDWRREGADVE